MAEYIANDEQTVSPGETVVFTSTTQPCTRGLVRHTDGTGSFLLSGWIPASPSSCQCNCQRKAEYLLTFSANIAVPTGEAVAEIDLAYSVDGATVPATIMASTPAAVEQFNNVSKSRSVPVWGFCCETVSIRNVSTIPILVRNASLIITRPDILMAY